MKNLILIFSLLTFLFISEKVSSQTATLEGSVFTLNKESDIRTGGAEIEIVLASAYWLNEIGADDNNATNELLDGFTGDQNWAKVVENLDYTHVNRISDTLVKISLPAIPEYYIADNELVGLVIPSSALVTPASSLAAESGFTINDESPSILVTGSIQSGVHNTENAIRNENNTLILEITGDKWDETLGESNGITQNLINGLNGSSSWNTEVVSGILGNDQGSSNVSLSGRKVTISIPEIPDYSISVNDVISIDIPASALKYTSSGTVSATPQLSISPAAASATLQDPGLTESNLGVTDLSIVLSEETFKNTSPLPGSFTHNGPPVISIESANYVSETEVTLGLELNGDIDENIDDFKITIAAGELNGGNPLTTNGISIVAEGNPVIEDVTIPEGIYGIGDTVFVMITVSDDGGDELTYSSGTVAGKELSFLWRQSSTLYKGGFILETGDYEYTSGESIPVASMTLTSGSLMSNFYSASIEKNIIFDLTPPEINYMQRTGETILKVGDNLDIIVSADGSGYTAVNENTRVNNVPFTRPNVTFFEILGSGIYKLRYTIEEGDNDVTTGNLTASLQLRDDAGNTSAINTSILSNTVSIDANSPKVTRISVDDQTYNIGDVIEVTIEADGNNYSATNDSYINGVFLASSAVSFSHISGNTYKLYYTVRNVDPEVLPGDLEVVLYLRDAAGNIGGPYSEVEANNLSIYTALPSALLTGGASVCEGDPAVLTVSLTGRSPWNIYVWDGNQTIEVTGIQSSPYDLEVFPLFNTTYRIDSVVDVNGTVNSGNGTALVSVLERTEVSIVNLNSSYYVEADPIVLEGNPPGGTFSGPGVRNGFFDPGEADTINSPHTLYYTYINGYGCSSQDSALVFVLGARGDLFIPKDLYCDNEEAFTITGSNVSDITGSFRLLNNGGEEISGLTDNGDNTATVNPGTLIPAKYTVEYSYTDGIVFTLREDFTIEQVEAPEIVSPVDTVFCQNIAPFLLESSVSAAVFEGPGVNGNVEDGFFFYPDSVVAGENVIVLTNTSVNGCAKSVSKTLTIHPVPELSFSADKLCVSSKDTVFFTNLTTNKDAFTEWKWIFDDVSDEDSISTEISPYHIFDDPGVRHIRMIGTTTEGCTDTLQRNIEFGDNPHGSFYWDNECFSEGNSVLFTSEMESSNPISNYEWTILGSGDEPVTVSGDSEMEYVFENMDSYRIRLYTETNIGCHKTLEKVITLKPTWTLTDNIPYEENFDGGNGWWTGEMSTQSDYISWNYDLADFENLFLDESPAWYTELPEDALHEDSWVKSPCFNLKNLDRPMISLDIYRSLIKDEEGVVLQGTNDGGRTWKVIGKNNDAGINWYNSNTINPGPANQAFGWTGNEPFAADDGWVNAKHQLDEFAGEERVQLRLAYRSENNQTSAEREGFAFDNVIIENRSKKVLLEHFTNTASTETPEIDGIVNNIYNTGFKDMVKLEYHTSFPGNDPLYEDNSSVPAARSFYYNVNSVPYSVLDGGTESKYSYNYSSDTLSVYDIRRKSLDAAPFDISIQTDFQTSSVTIDLDVTAREVLPQTERIIQVVVYEKLITGINTQNGTSNFLNVVKDMLPNGAGTAEFGGWNLGQTRSYQFSWNYENVYDPEMLRVAAFIQDNAGKEVYQVENQDTTNLNTSDKAMETGPSQLIIYPNPASNQAIVKIKGESSSHNDALLEVYDQTGRLLKTINLFPEENLKILDVSTFTGGVYLIKLRRQNSLHIEGIARLMIVR